MSEGSWQSQAQSFRLVVIDGSELGPDLNGGRLVCINGTGDEPLYMLTIDPEMCRPPALELVPEVQVVPRSFVDVPLAPIPEPSPWVLLALGLLGVIGWKGGR